MKLRKIVIYSGSIPRPLVQGRRRCSRSGRSAAACAPQQFHRPAPRTMSPCLDPKDFAMSLGQEQNNMKRQNYQWRNEQSGLVAIPQTSTSLPDLAPNLPPFQSAALQWSKLTRSPTGPRRGRADSGRPPRQSPPAGPRNRPRPRSTFGFGFGGLEESKRKVSIGNADG